MHRTFAVANLKNTSIMKIKFIPAMLAVAVFCIAACDKDDNKDNNNPDPVEVTAASAVAGTYNGNLTLVVMGADQGTEATSVTLVETDDDTVTLTLGGFPAMGTDLGDIVIEEVAVAKSGDAYSISADEFQSLGVPYGASTVNISGSLEGECDGENLSATFTLNLGAMPFPVTAYFTTDAQRNLAD